MTVTLPATTAGNLVVVAVLQNVDQVINSVTDTAGNTYSVAVSRFAGGAAGVFSIYYKENAAGIGTTNTITFAFAGDAGGGEIAVAEYSGVATSSSLDTTKTATGTTANPSSGSFTTAADNEVIFAFVGCVLATENYTAGSGYTAVAQPDGYTQSEEQLTNTAGAGKTATFTGGATTWAVAVAAFKLAGTVFNDTATLSASLSSSSAARVDFNPTAPIAAGLDYFLRGSGIVSLNGGFEKTAFENTAFYVLLGNSYNDAVAMAITALISGNYALSINPNATFTISTVDSVSGQLSAVGAVSLPALLAQTFTGTTLISLSLSLAAALGFTTSGSLQINCSEQLAATLGFSVAGGFTFSSSASMPASLAIVTASAFSFFATAALAASTTISTAKAYTAAGLLTLGVTAGCVLGQTLSAVAAANFAVTAGESTSVAGSSFGASVPLPLQTQLSAISSAVMNALMSAGATLATATAAVNVITRAIALGIVTALAEAGDKNTLVLAALVAESIAVIQALNAEGVLSLQTIGADGVIEIEAIAAEVAAVLQSLAAEAADQEQNISADRFSAIQ
jgi:hypothetical protein